MSNIDWDAVERDQRGRKRPRNYASRLCPLCGRIISESAYSGKVGNFKKHTKACEKKRK